MFKIFTHCNPSFIFRWHRQPLDKPLTTAQPASPRQALFRVQRTVPTTCYYLSHCWFESLLGSLWVVCPPRETIIRCTGPAQETTTTNGASYYICIDQAPFGRWCSRYHAGRLHFPGIFLVPNLCWVSLGANVKCFFLFSPTLHVWLI